MQNLQKTEFNIESLVLTLIHIIHGSIISNGFISLSMEINDCI